MRTRQYLDDVKSALKSRYSDLDPTASLALIALARASAAAARELQRPLEAHGLHLSGFEVLATLLRHDDPNGLTLSSLARRMAVTPASITNRIDHLVSKGLIERHGSSADRRVGYVRLTKAGAKLTEALLPEQLRQEAKLLKGLKKGERKDLMKLLAKLVDALESTGEGEAQTAE